MSPELFCPCCDAVGTKYEDGFNCKNCGHSWRMDQINYESKSGRNNFSNQILEKKLNERCNYILNEAGPAKKILEVGCAEGFLGKEIKRIKDVEYHGLEISEDINEAVKNLDLACRDKNLIKDNYYDLVLAFHTLEHVEDVNMELQSWKKKLTSKKDAKIIIEVPNKSGHRLIIFDKNKEHLHQFTVKSLTFLLERNGFYINKLMTGVFESPLYNDSIRITASLQSDYETDINKFVTQIKLFFPQGFYVFGIGGDFNNYIIPFLDYLPVLGLIDSDIQKSGFNIGKYVVTTKLDNLNGENILISSLTKDEEIREYLSNRNISASKIIGIGEFMNLDI
jgi:SAM-dependent methyltransferase